MRKLKLLLLIHQCLVISLFFLALLIFLLVNILVFVPRKVQMLDSERTQIHKVQMKLSHNSIDLIGQASFYDQMLKHNCAGIELDLVQNPLIFPDFDDASLLDDSSLLSSFEFVVKHGDQFDPSTPSLIQTLKWIRQWLDAKGNLHPPFFLTIDLKHDEIRGSNKIFAHFLDRILLKYLADDLREKFYTPCDLIHDSGIDEENGELIVGKLKWPTLTDLRGKIFLIVSGDDREFLAIERKYDYENSRPLCGVAKSLTSSPLGFIDMDSRVLLESKSASHGACKALEEHSQKGIKFDSKQSVHLTKNAILVNIQVPLVAFLDPQNHWKTLLNCSHDFGYLTRGWKVNRLPQYNEVGKMNMIATDSISAKWWKKSHNGEKLRFWKTENEN